MRRACRGLMLAALIATAPLLAGCGLAGGGSPPPESGSLSRIPTSPGEREGTAPAQPQTEPVAPASSPRAAVERFAEGYINWNYRTLAADQQRLAASAVGQARASELQARQQTERDSVIARGRVFNQGTVVAVAQVNGAARDVWVCVTREQTGGEGEYAALAVAYHVTLATVQQVRGRWAVSVWQPEL
jgi:hypothetical protein